MESPSSIIAPPDSLDPVAIMRENKRLKREIARMETMIERTKALQQTHLSYESEVQSEYIRQGKFFDFFLQKSPNIIIMLDNDGRFVYASKKLLDKMKIPAFGFLGAKKFSDMFMAEEYTPLRETIQAAIADKTAKEITLRTKWKADKEETDYVVNFLPMLTANTETEGLIIFAQDITEIIAAKDEAERATRVKSSFLANMSHEIRTPMNAVIGLADLLLREPLSEKAMDMAADIHQAGSSLLAIINDILDFSKIESGKMEIVEADYQLNLLLSELFNVLRPKLLESPLKLIVNVDKTLPKNLFGDEIRIRQILTNLLGNAVKYTREGFVKLDVTGQKNGDGTLNLSFSVSDSGIGISEENLKNLFVSFTQFDKHKNRGIVGTGLGLAISEQLATLMGGSISAVSEYGKGSTFTFAVKQRYRDETPIADSFSLVTEHHRTSNNRGMQSNFTAPGAKVLIVDDVVTNLKVAEGLMGPYQLQIETCQSGAEALENIAAKKYDLIFMDHMMPDMDGLETTRRIRLNAGYKDTPVIALTANAVSGVKEMFLEHGLTDFISKPIDPNQLEAVLIRWLPQEKCRIADKPEVVLEEAGQTTAGSSVIDGLDTADGIERVAGNEMIYWEILKVFVEDTPLTLRQLGNPAEASLKDYAMQVHGIKGGALNIGAVKVGEAAKTQELAAKSGDLQAVLAGHPTFVQLTLKLCADITEHLKSI